MRKLAWAILAVGLVWAAPAQAADSNARYALVHGCYALKSSSTGRYVAKAGDGYSVSASDAGSAERFRMQATALGRYMLYGHDRDYFSTGSGDAPAVGGVPGESADFRVDGDGPFTIRAYVGGRTLTVGSGGTLSFASGASGPSSQWSFEPARGCPEYPEAELDVSGSPSKGATPYSRTYGFVDAHMHMMAFEFLGGDLHCGRPWSPYGVTVALPDCSKTNVLANIGRVPVESVLTGHPSVDPVGWPTFRGWPAHNLLTYENSYYRWLERSWLAGQRLFVNLFVENHALCTIFPIKRNSCNEMTSVRLQHKDIYAMQDYIDAQAGGPGKGFFRIVKDPFEARRVINSGKLAVVLGIEVSNLFDCGITNGIPNCNAQDVDRRLAEAYNDLGVRDMELINKFDNAFGGVAGDSGTQGPIVNLGNRMETGQFWQLQTCQGPAEESDHEQLTVIPGLPRDSLVVNLFQQLIPAGTLPIYPPGPHCNTRGLSTLGEQLVRGMMKRGMIIDPDHLDVISRKELLNVVEAARYSGLISSHSWSTSDAYPRIYKDGGFVTPYAGGSASFVSTWRKLRKEASPKYFFGFGWGADMNGFGQQGGPRHGPNPVKYPFKSWDGKQTIDKQRSGQRVYDINTDGVAHYGLYPDWVEDLRMQAGDQIVKDLANGSEAYLEMWERAVGVASQRCRPAQERMKAGGLGDVALGVSAEELLRGGGQPASRLGRTWRYCAKAASKDESSGRVTVAFSPAGNSALVASTAPHHRIKGVGPRSRASRVPGSARAFGTGVRIAEAGHGRRFVFGIAKGRVKFVAVATAAAAKSPATLRSYLKLAKVS